MAGLQRTDMLEGPQPRSRVTTQRRLSEDEVAVLSESICDDLDSIGFSPNPNSGERGEQNLADLMTNRELVGVILSGGGPATLKASSGDSETTLDCAESRSLSTSGSRT